MLIPRNLRVLDQQHLKNFTRNRLFIIKNFVFYNKIIINVYTNDNELLEKNNRIYL